MRIEVLAFNGADDLDFIGPYEIFVHAARQVSDLEVRLVTPEPAEEVVTANGLRIRTEAVLSPAGHVELVVVPGGGWSRKSNSGARAQVDGGVLPKSLIALHAGGSTIAAVCTGSMILAHAGLLDGRPATTHHDALEELRQSAARVVSSRVVDDGDILTCGGVTSGLDMSLWLVERFCGEEASAAVGRVIEYERTQDIYRRAPS